MGYLLDTCVVSDFVKGEENTLKRLKSNSPCDVFISSLTVMEVKYGLAINPQRAVKIHPLIETFLSSITIRAERTSDDDSEVDPSYYL